MVRRVRASLVVFSGMAQRYHCAVHHFKDQEFDHRKGKPRLPFSAAGILVSFHQRVYEWLAWETTSSAKWPDIRRMTSISHGCAHLD